VWIFLGLVWEFRRERGGEGFIKNEEQVEEAEDIGRK